MNNQLLSGYDLAQGKTAPSAATGTLVQPFQMVPDKEKTAEWAQMVINWVEFQGIQQITRNAKRLIKNCNLASGIIDKSDYIIDKSDFGGEGINNEFHELVTALTTDSDSAYELKFFPIIPTIINALRTEFAERSSKIMFKTTDEGSRNEMLQLKKAAIEQSLLAEGIQTLTQKLLEQGVDLQGEQAQQMLNPDNVKSLPEIEKFFKESYQDIMVNWASRMHVADEERFYMKELEEIQFTNMLKMNREFWHFRMSEDDYDIEAWNPPQVGYGKAPGTRYMSDANWIVHVTTANIPDVIDKYGYLMSTDQLESLEVLYPVSSTGGYLNTRYQNDGAYYDSSMSYDANTRLPGLDFRRSTALGTNGMYGDPLHDLFASTEDFQNMSAAHHLRITTTYWKSQRLVGFLSKRDEDGSLFEDFVSEDYKPSTKPVYNTTVYKNRSAKTLAYGEHIEWIWVNDVWGGVKIGSNNLSGLGLQYDNQFNSIFLGIDNPHPYRLKFQFKGDNNLYGCKLPVEGAVFNDLNTKSISLVDTLKPYQIGHNLVNNQIADILIDELPPVVLIDQNALPRYSLGDDTGQNSYTYAWQGMRNFQILGMDMSKDNLEGGTQFQNFQKLDLSQTDRLFSRIRLAEYFKQQALESIGLNQVRMGQPVSQDTATGVEQKMNASYKLTEMLFTQHSDYLMPRVHSMRTMLAQYYNSTTPSYRLKLISDQADRINFKLNGTKWLMKDINISCSTSIDTRRILSNLKSLAMNNNTTGATLPDLAAILSADTIPEINSAVEAVRDRAEKARQDQMAHEQQLHQQEMESLERRNREKIQNDALQKQLDRDAGLEEARIRSASSGNLRDFNNNNQSDYQDYVKQEVVDQKHNEQMGLKREIHLDKMLAKQKDQEIQQQRTTAEIDKANKELQIARENQTAAELTAEGKLKKPRK